MPLLWISRHMPIDRLSEKMHNIGEVEQGTLMVSLALVNWGNEGSGLEIVRHLAARNWRVVLTGRQPAACSPG